jgi:hypothetical protein
MRLVMKKLGWSAPLSLEDKAEERLGEGKGEGDMSDATYASFVKAQEATVMALKQGKASIACIRCRKLS